MPDGRATSMPGSGVAVRTPLTAADGRACRANDARVHMTHVVRTSPHTIGTLSPAIRLESARVRTIRVRRLYRQQGRCVFAVPGRIQLHRATQGRKTLVPHVAAAAGLLTGERLLSPACRTRSAAALET